MPKPLLISAGAIPKDCDLCIYLKNNFVEMLGAMLLRGDQQELVSMKSFYYNTEIKKLLKVRHEEQRCI